MFQDAKSSQPSLIKIIWPFGSNEPNKNLTMFTQPLSAISYSLEGLSLSAEASLVSLKNLEEQLNTIYGIVMKEISSINVANAELLGAPWTRLGGNRAKISHFTSNLHFLKDLENYRSNVLACVVVAKLFFVHLKKTAYQHLKASPRILNTCVNIPLR